MHVPQRACGGQRAVFGSWVSSPTAWVPGIKLKSSDLAINTLIHGVIFLDSVLNTKNIQMTIISKDLLFIIQMTSQVAFLYSHCAWLNFSCVAQTKEHILGLKRWLAVWLKALVVLSEDLGSISSTHMQLKPSVTSFLEDLMLYYCLSVHI